jgi:hypothetical protein
MKTTIQMTNGISICIKANVNDGSIELCEIFRGDYPDIDRINNADIPEISVNDMLENIIEHMENTFNISFNTITLPINFFLSLDYKKI